MSMMMMTLIYKHNIHQLRQTVNLKQIHVCQLLYYSSALTKPLNRLVCKLYMNFQFIDLFGFDKAIIRCQNHVQEFILMK